MTKQLKARIERLEAKIPKPPSEGYLDRQIVLLKRFYLIAHWLGPADPNGSPVQDYARALGYSSSHELERAEERNDPDLEARLTQAVSKLYGLQGARPDDPPDDKCRALNALLAGLSDYYRRRMHDSIDSVVANWVRQQPQHVRDAYQRYLDWKRKRAE